jgi:hypothetical protein
MNLMLCMRGEPAQIPYLEEIARLGVGIELGSYGLVGIHSEADWEQRVQTPPGRQERFRACWRYGPFLGWILPTPIT